LVVFIVRKLIGPIWVLAERPILKLYYML